MADSRRLAFWLLGPVNLRIDGHDIEVGSAKQRALLSSLLLNANHAVSMSTLTRVLWDDDPPPSAQKNLHLYVHRIRQLLAGADTTERLVRRPHGYQLLVEPGELDVEVFAAKVSAARSATQAGDLAGAAALYDAAFELWHGNALADVTWSQSLSEAAEALGQRRLVALEERIEVALGLGRYEPVLAELESLVIAEPLRERFRGQLMVALYRMGRKADALSVYQDTRRVLATELGIDPGAALSGLHQAILADEHVLSPAPVTPPLPACQACGSTTDASIRRAGDIPVLYRRSTRRREPLRSDGTVPSTPHLRVPRQITGRQHMSAVLNLQKLRTETTQPEIISLSITSCDSSSCNG